MQTTENTVILCYPAHRRHHPAIAVDGRGNPLNQTVVSASSRRLAGLHSLAAPRMGRIRLATAQGCWITPDELMFPQADKPRISQAMELQHFAFQTLGKSAIREHRCTIHYHVVGYSRQPPCDSGVAIAAGSPCRQRSFAPENAARGLAVHAANGKACEWRSCLIGPDHGNCASCKGRVCPPIHHCVWRIA